MFEKAAKGNGTRLLQRFIIQLEKSITLCKAKAKEWQVEVTVISDDEDVGDEDGGDDPGAGNGKDTVEKSNRAKRETSPHKGEPKPKGSKPNRSSSPGHSRSKSEKMANLEALLESGMLLSEFSMDRTRDRPQRDLPS